MVHGGPFPATTHAATSSVGTRAICRFARLVAFQNTPQELLPLALRDGNPQQIWRMIDGVMTH
jgi:NADP-dependent aldehyde dehydrogenase